VRSLKPGVSTAKAPAVISSLCAEDGMTNSPLPMAKLGIWGECAVNRLPAGQPNYVKLL